MKQELVTRLSNAIIRSVLEDISFSIGPVNSVNIQSLVHNMGITALDRARANYKRQLTSLQDSYTSSKAVEELLSFRIKAIEAVIDYKREAIREAKKSDKAALQVAELDEIIRRKEQAELESLSVADLKKLRAKAKAKI